MNDHPDVSFSVGTIDDKLDENGTVIPGLGDAGDRQFGTAPVMEEEEALKHPSRRKRTLSQSTE